jgi:hypothetical protein
MQIDVTLDRREPCRAQRIPRLLGVIVGGATRQRHEAAEIAQHSLAKFVRKQRRLHLRRIDSCAKQRAERRGAGQPKRALQSASS